MTDPTLSYLLARASWPNRIYLQTGGIDMADYTDCEVTWCVDEIDDSDIAYVRDDLLHAANAERDALRESVDEWREEVKTAIAMRELYGRKNIELIAERDAIRDAFLALLQDVEALERELAADKAVRDAATKRAEDAEAADAILDVLYDAEALERDLAFTKAERDEATERAERAEAEVARLRHEITEASNPDFLWGAMDNVVDEDTTISDFATAASRAIRAAVFRSGVAGTEGDDND